MYFAWVIPFDGLLNVSSVFCENLDTYCFKSLAGELLADSGNVRPEDTPSHILEWIINKCSVP